MRPKSRRMFRLWRESGRRGLDGRRGLEEETEYYLDGSKIKTEVDEIVEEKTEKGQAHENGMVVDTIEVSTDVSAVANQVDENEMVDDVNEVLADVFGVAN